MFPLSIPKPFEILVWIVYDNYWHYYIVHCSAKCDSSWTIDYGCFACGFPKSQGCSSIDPNATLTMCGGNGGHLWNMHDHTALNTRARITSLTTLEHTSLTNIAETASKTFVFTGLHKSTAQIWRSKAWAWVGTGMHSEDGANTRNWCSVWSIMSCGE